jgi:RNA recognition motif-containing protein
VLYVGNLSFGCAEDVVREAFSTCGVVRSVRIIRHPDTGRSLGFAFVDMEDEASAERAQREWNNRELCGRTLRVVSMRPRDDRERI